MQTAKKTLGFLLLVAIFSIASISEARVGAGRSSGSRGSRGFSSSPPGRSPGFGNFQSSPRSPSPFAPSNPYGSGSGQGSFFRGLAGGVAGGFLGSMLFRGLGGGMGGYGYGGGGGIGLLDILLLGGLAYLIFRLVTRRRYQPAEGTTYAPYSSIPQDYSRQSPEAFRSEVSAEVFQDKAVIDALVDNFFKIQAGWMHRDLNSIQTLLTPEMKRVLDEDADKLKAAGRVNKLENITVRETEITESWSEDGKDYVTLRLLANVLDYTVDERTGTVVEGDKTNPVKFEEYWTFVRERGQAIAGHWQLSAIQNF